jgi:hypothetical protein
MRTYSSTFYFDQILLIATHTEFLLQKAYYAVNEKPIEPLAKPSEMQQDSPVADLSESFTIHALI